MTKRPDLTPEQIAWCGGVIDAIGLVRLRETDAGSSLAYVSVSTALLPIAQRLADLTGTSVTTVRREYNRLGCSQHCTEAHQHVQSVTARWSLTGARALTFLQAIHPFLGVKIGEVDEVIAAAKDAPSKPRTTEKMASLGWPIGESA